ncbi:MAG: DUF5615 family PIN-like protein [Gammaproteobacteria bacterium]|nr:DUF5615 family PIN-like protein [Gammaproteobacteria bacterium]
MAEAPDRKIWGYAHRENAILVTKDDDFVALQALEKNGPTIIVWIRVGNTTKRALLVRVDQYIETIETMLRNGERLIEVI